MSNMMRYILLNQEKGKDLLLQHQAEVDTYNYPSTSKEIEAELSKDRAYLEFIETVNEAF